MATETEPTEVAQTVDEQSDERSRSGISWKMALTSGVMGLVIGAFAAWATLNLGVAPVAFLVGLGGGGYYLYRKPIPSAAVGSGLYITALVMILTPLMFYIPVILRPSGDSAAAAGAFIGSVLGLVIWGFVFLLLAIVTAAIGYFFSRRANKKLAA